MELKVIGLSLVECIIYSIIVSDVVFMGGVLYFGFWFCDKYVLDCSMCF